jgi:hypothetical protein
VLFDQQQKKIQEKKQWNNLIFFYRYIRDTPSDRSDRANGQPRTKEQSRSLPRIPLPVSDLLVKIKYLNLFFFSETKHKYQS